MIVSTFLKEKVVLADEPLASGGEGEVRKVISSPEKYSGYCAKLYYKPRQTKEQEGKIRFMVENPPSSIVGKGMMLAWPLETIYKENGDFVGFIMPTAYQKSSKLVILILPKLKKIHKAEWYKFDKERNIKTALVSRMKLINNIAIPIHLLHATGKYVLKDFKPDNVLVTPTGKITIVDMDSIQICDNGQLLFPGTASTESYMPPEFYNKGVGRDLTKSLDISWDNFALAEVFYQIMFGLNPYAVSPKSQSDDSNTLPYCISHNLFPYGNHKDGIATVPKPHNNFKIIPRSMQSLFIRAFGDKPNERPNAMEWGKTVKQILRSIPPEPEPSPQPVPTPETSIPSEPAQKYCPKCGSAISTTSRFCKVCGYDLEGKKKPSSIWIIVIIVMLAVLLLISLLLGCY